MRCLECGDDLDELNETKPFCPFCGAPPGVGRDDDGICGLSDDATLSTAASDNTEDSDSRVDPNDPARLPRDLKEALDDAESLLLAVGLIAFDRPEGFRLFPLVTERIM